MDKKTLLAVVLSVVIIAVSFMVQNLIWPAAERENAAVSDQPATDERSESATESDERTETTTTVSRPDGDTQTATTKSTVAAIETEETIRERNHVIETDIFIATLSNRGGEVTSLKLKEQLDDERPVEMIYTGETGVSPFFVMFNDANGTPVDVAFEQAVRGPYSIEYSREFLAPAGDDGNAYPFTLLKKYTFQPGEYMFELEITIDNSVNEFPNLDFNGVAYTLGFGPQIGPEFGSLGGRGEYRYYYTHADGKRKNNKFRNASEIVVNTRFNWAGIVGKYFALFAIADDADFTLTFRQPRLEGLPSSSFIYLSRPFIRSSKNSDVYRFYAGPKIRKTLSRYNDPLDNAFALADRDLDDAVDSSALLGWLESILRFFLDVFYRVVPNYGVAIILLTIFVKALLFPITRKSYESTSKMSAINPQITEIREKYKDNPNRMNQEMAALYKREKVSPLGGCLPLLLQMPMFLAMYRVMSSHFSLRGAPFFWWITDLSEPESILSFGGFQIPLLGWTDLRLLPILFVATQVISTKFMQQPGAQTNKNMKLMSNLMPVFFFFILYNVPSGLLIYWIMTNVLTSAQQKLIAYYRKSHPGEDSAKGGDTRGGKGPPKTGPSKGPGKKPGPSTKGPGGGKKK